MVVVSPILDCSKAGDFQSITSQFSRSRQSRQFSFREDVQVSHAHNNRQPVQHEFDRSVYDDQIKVFNNHIKQFDARIDTMETTINGLTDSLSFMQKKVTLHCLTMVVYFVQCSTCITVKVL